MARSLGFQRMCFHRRAINMPENKRAINMLGTRHAAGPSHRPKLQHLRDSLPEQVAVQQIGGWLPVPVTVKFSMTCGSYSHWSGQGIEPGWGG